MSNLLGASVSIINLVQFVELELDLGISFASLTIKYKSNILSIIYKIDY